MIKFKSNCKDFLCIEVAPDAKEINCHYDNEVSVIVFESAIQDPLKCGGDMVRMEGNWKIILCTNSYTEEESALVVEGYFDNIFLYKNYLSVINAFKLQSSIQSFQSLMESIGCPIVNNYGEKPDEKYYNNLDSIFNIISFRKTDYDNDLEKWQAEQSKIKTFIILQKL